MRHIFILLLSSFTFSLLAQDQVGVNPPSLKWSKMATPAGDIIYPRGMDSTAKSLAYRINSAFLLDTSEVLYRQKSKGITTILQNQSAIPEGFATTAPWRQELYLTPPQNMFMGPSIWRDALTTHEYRHAQQFMAYNKGWTHVYKVLMGNTGWLLSTVLNVPLWYREGDAVDSETRFSTGGRGSLPAFHMEYRTLRLKGIHYNYEKAMSAVNFRDFVPNMYRSGYYMSTRLRRMYDADAWAKVMDQSTKKLFYPFTRALKKLSGEATSQWYTSTFTEQDSLWALTDTIAQTRGEVISVRSGVFEKYRMPQFDAQGNLIVAHESFRQIRGFYRLSEDGNKKRIKTAGIYTSDHENFTVEGNLMAWGEAAFNPRYRNKTFSVIKYLDLQTGKVTQLSRRSKYFSPAPSKDGQFMAVVEYDEFERCALAIISLKDQGVVQKISYPGHFLAQPRWINDRELVMVSINQEGNQLVKVNLVAKSWEVLLNAWDVNISNPYPYEGSVYFSSGLTGIENIYRLDPETGETVQVSQARFGAFDPFVREGVLYFANYDELGYEVWRLPLENSLERTVSFPQQVSGNSEPSYFEAEVKDPVDSLLSIETEYKGFFWNKFFHTYGWFPLFFPPELGAEFYTLNLERSFKSTLALSYNINENIIQTHLMGSYAKFFPIINGGFTIQSRNIQQAGPEYGVDSIASTDNRETILTGGLEVPLNLTQGVYNAYLNLRADVSRHVVEEFGSTQEPFSFNAAKVGFTAGRLRPLARRQVRTPFGQRIQAHYKRGFEEMDPQQLFVNARFFFPGIVNTHSFNVRASYEDNEQTANYRYLSLLQTSRGYQYYPFDRYYGFSANYEFPVLYPDLYVPAVVGLTRVRFNAFYDHAMGTTASWEQFQRSVGGEFILDLRLFRAFNMGLKLQFIQRLDAVDSQQPFVFNLGIDYFELLN